MILEGKTALPVNGARDRVRIRVSGPTRLRDYFLRLGAHAEVVGEETVLVEGDRHAIGLYLGSWSSINRIRARVESAQADVFSGGGSPINSRPRLGDLLLGKGMITESQLDEGLVESRTNGELLGRILLRRGWIFEDELARTLAEQLGIPYISLRNAGVDYAVASLIPLETGLHFAAIPIGVLGSRVRIAFADPCDQSAHQAVATYVPNYEGVVAELSDIELAWRTVARRNER